MVGGWPVELDAHGTEGVRRSDGHHTVTHGPSEKPHIVHLLWYLSVSGVSGLGPLNVFTFFVALI